MLGSVSILPARATSFPPPFKYTDSTPCLHTAGTLMCSNRTEGKVYLHDVYELASKLLKWVSGIQQDQGCSARSLHGCFQLLRQPMCRYECGVSLCVQAKWTLTWMSFGLMCSLTPPPTTGKDSAPSVLEAGRELRKQEARAFPLSHMIYLTSLSFFLKCHFLYLWQGQP